MGYWDKVETKHKLNEAYRKFEPKRKVVNGKFKRLRWKLQKESCNTSFGAMYVICHKFKCKYHNKEKQYKISRLKQLSSEKIANSIPYEQRRTKKHCVPVNKKCWICYGKATVQHHIILIKNGGYDNGINRICICDNCHELIHDWMPIKRRERKLDEELKLAVERE